MNEINDRLIRFNEIIKGLDEVYIDELESAMTHIVEERSAFARRSAHEIVATYESEVIIDLMADGLIYRAQR